MRTASRKIAPVILGALVLAGSAMGPTQDRPYLPKPEIPDNPGNDPLLQMEISSVRAAQVPGRSQVAIPPYANALVIGSTPLKLRSDGDTVVFARLPTLTLVTVDAPERVLAFYEQQLPDWSHAEILAGHYFWRDDREFSPFHPSADTTETVHVRVSRRVKIVPDARTEIHIRYRPARGGAYQGPSGQARVGPRRLVDRE